MKKKAIIISFISLCFSCCSPAQSFNIYSDFPSGNISIEKIKNDTLYLHPDLRDTKGDWFYWCFAVDNAKGKKLTFLFTKPNVITTKGPAISTDSGYTWEYLGDQIVHNETFSYNFSTNDEVRFSMGMPYTKKQFSRFINPYLGSGNIKLDTLAISEKGNEIERLIIKPPMKQVKYKVLITARHHCCEMMADYLMEGIIQEVLKNEWMRNNIEFCFIPFVDTDGVENGDQGKNRKPHDHNRDYSDSSIYVSTRALRNWIPFWSEKKMVIAMDLHCPWIKGDNHENIYVVGSEDEKKADQEKLFCRILKTTNNSELKVSDKIYLAYGKDWNSASNYTEGFSFGKWVSTIEGVKLSVSLEFPYANNEGQTINQINSRAFGTDLAKALEKYLMQL
jgi:hypothetical protein